MTGAGVFAVSTSPDAVDFTCEVFREPISCVVSGASDVTIVTEHPLTVIFTGSPASALPLIRDQSSTPLSYADIAGTVAV